MQVDIVYTKRLGKPSTSSTAKTLPLLVNVKNVNHAKLIISSARQLRQSTVPFIRDNIFINPNLTKAEASAAYELRCRQRELASQRSAFNHQPGSSANQLSSISPPDTNVLPTAASSSTVSALSLNAVAPSFVPSSSLSANI